LIWQNRGIADDLLYRKSINYLKEISMRTFLAFFLNRELKEDLDFVKPSSEEKALLRHS